MTNAKACTNSQSNINSKEQLHRQENLDHMELSERMSQIKHKIKFCLCGIGLFLAGLPAGCQSPKACTENPHRPSIQGARVFGVRPGTEVLYTIAATGKRPMRFSADNLPRGLRVNPNTGRISGAINKQGEYPITLQAQNDAGADTKPLKIIVGDELALTPPMGWMSWNMFGRNISDTLIRQIADAMVASGMRDAGYEYICIDDHWCNERDKEGRMIPIKKKFPHGMKVLADYVHSKGLKLGVYSDAAPKTCGGAMGSYDHEELDAQTFAQWGIDYLKYDYCGAPKDRKTAQKRYLTMAQALRKSGRSIVFGICEWGTRQPWEWAPQVGGQLWRTTWDIRDIWDHGKYDAGHCGIINGLDHQVGLEKYSGPGYWNDPDMLIVGLYGKGDSSSHNNANGCTDTEYRSQMSLWCLLASPLLATCDLRNMNETTIEILTNPEVIAVNQDPLGQQAGRIFKEGDIEIWARDLVDGSKAVGLLNRGETKTTITITWPQLNLKGTQTVRDLWQHKNLGKFSYQFQTDVDSHQVVLIKIS